METFIRKNSPMARLVLRQAGVEHTTEDVREYLVNLWEDMSDAEKREYSKSTPRPITARERAKKPSSKSLIAAKELAKNRTAKPSSRRLIRRC